MAIDSGHLSYHLENLGELVTRTQDGKYSLSSFGISAVKLMGGVEEYDARKTSRSKAVTIAKIFSLALALTLLVVSFYSMNLVTSTQTNDAYGLSNTPLALAQNQTFNYFFNFTQKSPAYMPNGMVVGSPSGMLVVDPQLSGSINEWVEYYPRVEIDENQTYSLEFTHTFLNITLRDSKGNIVNSPGATWGVDSRISYFSGGITRSGISRPDNYSMEVQNLGPEWFYANVSVYVVREYLQKPVFYYGLTGLIMTSSYLAVFFAGWGWTKRPRALARSSASSKAFDEGLVSLTMFGPK